MTSSVGRPKHVDRAGEIIRSLSPRALGTVWLLGRGEAQTQVAIADQLACTPPAVSKHLRALSELAVPLVEKLGSRYTVTSAGYAVLDVVNELLIDRRDGLSTIDWSGADDRTMLQTALAPLTTTRSSQLFTVLSAFTSVGSFDASLSAPFTGTVSRAALIETATSMHSGTGASRRTLRRRLAALASNDCIELAADTITVTEKGTAQLWLFSELVQIVEVHESETPETIPESDNGQLKDRTVVGFSPTTSDTVVEPTLCVDDEPVVAIPESITVDELLDMASELGRQYDGSQSLTRKWTTVRTS